jgi:hypothetical protein
MVLKFVGRTLACTVLVSACSSDPVNSGRGLAGAAAGTVAGTGGVGGAGTGGAAGDYNPMGGFGGAGLGGFAALGGEGGGDPEECSGVSEMAENMVQPVDIIFGIDTSGSMGEEILFVQENLNAFSQQIIDSGVDVRVIMLATEGSADAMGECIEIIPGFPCVPVNFGNFGVCIGAPLGSGMCPADSNPPIYQHVPAEVGSNDVLNVFISAYPQYSQFLRPGSLKHFVSITDDDATDGPYNNADAFIAAVAALDPDPAMWASWSYSSIYCFTECPAAAEIGLVHQDLVAKTMGVGGDLCLQDFGPVFDKLATEVAESVQLACEWEIPPPPDGETFDSNKTNVELVLDGTMELLPRLPAGTTDCAELGAWRYDDEANPTRVLACPSACTRIQSAANASVKIVFGCDTVPIVVQ